MITKSLYLLLFVLLMTSCQKKQTPQVDVSSEIEAIENGLIKAIRVKGKTPETYNIMARMKAHNIPGASIAIILDGKIQWAKGYGIANTENGKPVDTTTLFQAGSISKPLAALAALHLVQQGHLDLDVDINNYLKSWALPDSEFTSTEKVTLRRLLTHTAGMTVHGFPGYAETDTFPSINNVLNGKGNTPPVFVDTIPGSIWRYSGGGYTVMEKIVEDRSEMPLEEYMGKNILPALKMSHSTYDQPLPKNLHQNASAAYFGDGKIIPGLWHNYPEQAAAGLWTTPNDLAKYLIEIHKIYTGHKNGVLSKDMVTKMLTKHKNDWGLGPSLRWANDSLIFGHGGKNAGFTNDMFAFAKSGNGVVVMTSADNGGKLIGEILRAVSKQYEWGTHVSEEVEIIKMTDEDLQPYIGKYLLNFQVPEIGDYFIDVTLKDGKLEVNDINNGDTNSFTPRKDLKFIDLDKGDQIEIKTNDSGEISFQWNKRYTFNKVNE